MANYKAVFIGTGMIGAGLGANALLHDFVLHFTML